MKSLQLRSVSIILLLFIPVHQSECMHLNPHGLKRLISHPVVALSEGFSDFSTSLKTVQASLGA
jgi:hypothetical protein